MKRGPSTILPGLLPQLISSKDNQSFLTAPTELEVAFSIGKSKAPSPDSFNAAFYHKYWDIVKGPVMTLVQTFFFFRIFWVPLQISPLWFLFPRRRGQPA